MKVKTTDKPSRRDTSLTLLRELGFGATQLKLALGEKGLEELRTLHAKLNDEVGPALSTSPNDADALSFAKQVKCRVMTEIKRRQGVSNAVMPTETVTAPTFADARDSFVASLEAQKQVA